MNQVLDRPPVRATAGSKLGHRAFEPLDAAELRDVVAIVRRDPDFAFGIFFETIELLEPSPEALREGMAAREARANLFRDTEDGVWRVTVSIARAVS